MLTKQPDFYPAGVNNYVPEMKYASDVHLGHKTRAYFGAPSVADTDGIHTGLDADGAATVTSFTAGTGGIGATADATYGRCVSAKAGAAVGTGTTVVVTVTGTDYLGQPMTETLSVAHASGTNTISGVKAFKKVTEIKSDGGASVATTIDVGWLDKLGLPYATVAVEREHEDNVVAATNGTLVAAVFTDPQTATTADPRGTYDPNGTLDGSAIFEADIVVTNYVNSSGNGGLHGIAHYVA